MLEPPRRERIFNVPVVVLVLLAILGLLHAYLVLALTAEQTTELVQYLRSMSGKPPWPDVAAEVRRIEGDSR
jgi:predicted PurR-regulated permease PerM